jgi:uncharacterized Fe-S center protein
MKSDVFYVDFSSRPGRSVLDRFSLLFERAGLAGVFQPGDLVALKIHVGQPGSATFLPHVYAGRTVRLIKESEGNPFLTDANTLYAGGRSNAVDHTRAASLHGFNLECCGAPFIVADGLNGHEYHEVPLNGDHVKKARIASAVVQADSIIALSHFKGHEVCGFGGALKNLGMGCACRSGKQIQHSDIHPRVNAGRCVSCGVCLKWCPAGAISQEGKNKAVIDPERCVGCAECVVACRSGAISINWNEGAGGTTQRKMVEYAAAVLMDKKERCGFINVLANITQFCDCYDGSGNFLVPDIGILASRDPVAIDQASVDMVNAAPRAGGTEAGYGDLFESVHAGVSWRHQLEHAVKIGLGSREYRLVDLN